jgi:circadian clock protein KaiB
MTAPRTSELGAPTNDGGGTKDPPYELTLFVSGPSDVSEQAIANARKLCDVYLVGRARLAVVDVQADDNASLDERMLATPTLARTFPLPVKRAVGELTDAARTLATLGLRAENGC